MRKILTLITAMSLLMSSSLLLANNLTVNAPVLTLEGAKVIAAAAAKKAQAENWQVVIVISDSAGDIKSLERMENVQLASLEIAINKAKNSVLYRRPTAKFSEGMKEGNIALASLPEMIPFAGGVPIKADGYLIGAVGVSGVKGFQDAEIAQAGIDEFLKQLAK